MKLFILLISIYAYKSLEEFIYTSSDEFDETHNIMMRPEISGVQLVYSWKSLEKDKDVYNFSKVKEDLTYLKSKNRKLFMQVQDRFFSMNAKYVPKYLLEDPIYQGGLAQQNGTDSGGGWVAKQWVPEVRHRYQKLLSNLAHEFDGEIYGINLPETAIDVVDEVKENFTCTAYFDAELENAAYARAAFRKSYVVQYVNFWPCEWNNDHEYMSRTFEFAKQHNLGLGGPDTIPYKDTHMNNSYPFFHKNESKIYPKAMAVQEPDLKYNHTKHEFYDFAKNYLNSNMLFWTKCIFNSSLSGC